ncbi:MAG TPA: hypothetical protein VHW66_22075 [Stellaceae bacterium]|nr:hypothetical protein [Stellaceae bacterium]
MLVEATRRTAAGRDGCRLTLQDFDANSPAMARRCWRRFGCSCSRRLCQPPQIARQPSWNNLYIARRKAAAGLIAAAQTGIRSLLDDYLCWLTRPDRRMSVVTIAASALRPRWARRAMAATVARNVGPNFVSGRSVYANTPLIGRPLIEYLQMRQDLAGRVTGSISRFRGVVEVPRAQPVGQRGAQDRIIAITLAHSYPETCIAPQLVN